MGSSGLAHEFLRSLMISIFRPCTSRRDACMVCSFLLSCGWVILDCVGEVLSSTFGTSFHTGKTRSTWEFGMTFVDQELVDFDLLYTLGVILLPVGA